MGKEKITFVSEKINEKLIGSVSLYEEEMPKNLQTAKLQILERWNQNENKRTV